MKDIKYEEAVRQLEKIVDKMESGELDIDSMAAQLKKAQELVKLCKAHRCGYTKALGKGIRLSY